MVKRIKKNISKEKSLSEHRAPGCLKNVLILMILLVFLTSIIPSVSAEVSVCCEKTDYGAWCQNEEADRCDDSFKVAPTACDSTSFCKAGCCFDTQEGLCMESTPQRTCNEISGFWSEGETCNIPQCNLGCCVLGDQASLVTLTRCKKISAEYGLTTDFRIGIQDENQCIAVALSSEISKK